MLHHADAGTGDAITFLHGFALDGRQWDDQAAAFAPAYRVIRPDLPGFGRSPAPAPGVTVADELRALLDHLGVTRTHVVGLSLGGGVATDFALACPERVQSLVLADALLLGYPAPLSAWPECTARAQRGDVAGANEHWLGDPVFDRARRRPALWARLAAMAREYHGAHWAGTMRLAWASTKPRPRLPEIAVPTLLIVGEHDTPGFRAMADVYAAEIPGAKQHVIPGAGHVSNMEEPAAFNAVLRAFLAGVPA